MDDFYVNIVVAPDGTVLKIFKDMDAALCYCHVNSYEGYRLKVIVRKVF